MRNVIATAVVAVAIAAALAGQAQAPPWVGAWSSIRRSRSIARARRRRAKR